MTITGVPHRDAIGLKARTSLIRLFEITGEEQRRLWKKNFAPENPNLYRGWFPLESGETGARQGFDIGPDLVRDLPEDGSSDLLYEPSCFPSESTLPGWRRDAENYYLAMESIGAALLASISRGIGIPEDIFRDGFHEGISTLRLVHYVERPFARKVDRDPATTIPSELAPYFVEAADGRAEIVCGGHFDTGLVTILGQFGVDGLQARLPNGDWVDIPPTEDGFVINFGGLLARWTGGHVRATMHRVLSTGKSATRFPSSSNRDRIRASSRSRSPVSATSTLSSSGIISGRRRPSFPKTSDSGLSAPPRTVPGSLLSEPPPTTELVADPVTRREYALLGFLTLLNVMNFVDRQLLASFANDIVPELGLSNTQFGILTGFGFIVFYAAMGLFAGALADRVHRPRLIAAALTLWSVLTAASGAARGFLSLLAPRMFIGVGESVLTPASMSMLSDRFPASRMGFASGFYYMGVPIGVALSLLIKGYLGPVIGWRNCFYLLGAIGVLLAVFMLLVKETRPAAPRNVRAGLPGARPEGSGAGFADTLRSLFRALASTPALAFTIAGGVAFHFILGAGAFDQLWYVEERGFEKDRIAQISGWISMAGGIAGNLFGGFAGDWWQRHTSSGRPMFLFWIGVVFVPIGLLYRIIDPGSVWFFVAIGAGYFQLGCFYGPTFATVQELTPPRIRGTIVGFYILALNLIGLGIGITGGGILVDALAARGYAEPYTATLLVFTALSALAIPCFWIAGRRFFKDRDRLST